MIMQVPGVGKTIIAIGLAIAAAGGVVMFFERTGLQLFRLPGDIVVQRKNFSFYFPVATSIIISMVLSFIVWFMGRGGK